MAVDPGALDATLAAAVGDDPLLAAELRAAFVAALDSAQGALCEATTVEGWTVAADRIEAIAGSFGAQRLMAGARDARRRPHDTSAVKRLARQIDRLR